MTALPQPGLGLTVATFAVVIGLLVFVHEMGHYLVARWLGIKADAFSIGFGREIAGWTDRHGTRWKVGMLPLGGYVKFAGDADAASRPDQAAVGATAEERAGMFQFRPVWQRTLVILAGPITNFLFAIAIFTGFIVVYGQSVTPPVVGRVLPGSPAAAAGLLPGDRIIRIDGSRIGVFEDLLTTIQSNVGTPVRAEIERGTIQREVVIAPRIVDRTNEFGDHFRIGQIGIAPARQVIVSRPLLAAPYYATVEVGKMIGMIGSGLMQVITGQRPANELGGPIKIARYEAQAATLGLPTLIERIAFISINLGFINLLPVPMLDGGHLFLYAVEAVRRRPLAARVQEWAFMSGFAALMSLMIFLTWNDLAGVGAWRRLSGLFG